jgi:hypothetical protein
LPVSKRTRYEILRRDQYTCRFCGASAPWVLLEIDHVIPRSEGGTDAPENLQVLCVDCNAGKSATMPERWLVAETKHIGRDSLREPPEDDYSEMYAYMDAYAALEALPSEQVLMCIMHVMADVYPYRPDGPELIQATAKLAAEGYGAPREEVLP